MPAGTLRLAMWSGPRTISTALMRSFGNRADTLVCDEPLYAHYLAATGARHPGAAEVIRHHETDWRRVVETLIGPVPAGHRIFYQKQMAHHLLEEIDRSWLDRLTSAFLIRDPGEMLISLRQHLPEPTLADTGLPQQLEIFERSRRRTACWPPVIDARDLLDDPEGMLRRLCEVVEVPFDPAMLSWPAGPQPTDGIWGKHWYDAVNRSTGFRPYAPRAQTLPARFGGLHEACREAYDKLRAHRLVVG